jgi:hypothetical protein
MIDLPIACMAKESIFFKKQKNGNKLSLVATYIKIKNRFPRQA